ncbi:hypothetical protein Tco_0401052 [Tanacetum coccineum]
MVLYNHSIPYCIHLPKGPIIAGMGLWQESARAYSVSGFCDTRWTHFIRVRREVSKVVSVVDCVLRRIKAFALCGSLLMASVK